MRSFDRLRSLYRSARPPRSGSFEYSLLSRCYPVADAILAAMIGVDASHLSYWKRGKLRPCRTARQTIALLCWIRCGGPRSVEEIVHLGHAMRSGKFERMVNDYLDREAKLIAARQAKLAAQSETKVDKPTLADVESAEKPAK